MLTYGDPSGDSGGSLLAGWRGVRPWDETPSRETAAGSAASPARPALEPTWRDLAWASLVGRADAVLRRCQGVFEFTDDPECVLRLQACLAEADLVLSDGTRIAAGEPVGGIHFWNEHLPPFPKAGPDLRWAKAMQHCMALSLIRLAAFAEQAPEWRSVRAFGGGAPFCGRLCAMRIRRVTARYGFDLVEDETSGHPWHGLGGNIVLWALARAFNPVANQRQPFLRERHELWISRGCLLRRFGPAVAEDGDVAGNDVGANPERIVSTG